MDNELLSAKIAAWRPKALWPEGGRDDEPDGLAFDVSFLWPGAGLARVDLSRAGVYRFFKRTTSPAIAHRRGPTGPCPDADLADHIRREIEASDFHGEGYRRIWARLRVPGVARAWPRAPGDGGGRLFAPIASGTTERRRTTEPSSPTRSMKCGELT